MALSRPSVAGGLPRRPSRQRRDRGNDPRLAAGSRSSRTVKPPRFHTDFIVLDNFTHLLGCWGLDYLSEGDVVFPLSMDELEIFGDRPREGTDVACRITVTEIERHRLRVESEIIRPDGSVWMRIRDWEDWRFHWPGRYRDVMRQPRDFWLGEELELDRPGQTARSPRPRPSGSSLPPTWAGRSGATCSSRSSSARPSEPRFSLPSATSGSAPISSGGESPPRRPRDGSGTPRASRPSIPADLAVVADQHGRPELFSLAAPADSAVAAVSIAHCDGVAVAIAAADPAARVGIDVETIAERPEGFEASAFSAGGTAPL